MKKHPELKTFNVMDIESPAFLKQLNIDELEALCDSIRKFIIENVSKTGGHLSSNLGSVEAVVAMHYVFDSPKDKFLFDVGHQSYTHKILTGRAKDFVNLRQKDGLSGFPSYEESEHDVFESGHSSSSISAACGFLEAKEINKEIGEVIAFIGDGSITNGLAFEGLDYLGSQKKQKAIIILNDNEMSISKNVGRMAKRFSKIRISKSYAIFKKITPTFLKVALSRMINSAKGFVYGNNFFYSLGYKYYGPIDGHNIKELINFFEFAKNAKSSIVLHVKTIKGKGYNPALNDAEGKWHGVGKFDVVSGEMIDKTDDNMISWSDGISQIVDELFEKHGDKLRLINPATIYGSSLNKLKEKYGDKIIDVGINEEHALVMASAIARNGLVPIVSIYSTFLQRAYDYLNNDINRVNAHVIFLIDRAGLVAADGETHQGIYDISMLSPLKNFEICMPSNLSDANAIINYAYNHNGPIAIRYPKENTLINYNKELIIDKPKWLCVNPIRFINVLTYGSYINELKEKLINNVGLINALFIKPIDKELLKSLNNSTLIIVEEVVKEGSLYSLVIEAINELNLNIKVKSFNIDDKYPHIGTREELRKECNIDVESILEYIDNIK